MAKKTTAEEFLRKKLEDELQSFGVGMTEFHTADLQFLVQLLDSKDEEIKELKEDRLNWFNIARELQVEINKLRKEIEQINK